MYDCPICRQQHAVGNADAHNLDQTLQTFMLLYFPKEIKEKRKENELEQASLNKQQQQIRLPARQLASSASRNMLPRTTTRASRDSGCNIM